MAGKAKMLGTLVCVGGAMLLTFYKGAEIKLWSSIDILHQHDRGGHPATSQQEYSNRVLGSSLAVASCLSYSTWLIIQTKMSAKYPCYYSSTAMLCGMASVQAVVFALCMERDWAKWKLGFNIRLLTVAYSGILASGLMVTVLTWCMRLRGPLFVSVFNPLMLVLVALAGSFLLNEKLHLGSVLGAILIVGGLYIVLWGKAKEMKKSQPLTPSKSGTSERIDVVITSTTSNTNDSSLHCVDELADIDLDNLELKSSSVSDTNASQRPSIQ